MKKGRYTEEQIAYALRQAEAGTKAGEISRQLGISEQIFYTWKRKYRGMGVAELRRLKQLGFTIVFPASASGPSSGLFARPELPQRSATKLPPALAR